MTGWRWWEICTLWFLVNTTRRRFSHANWLLTSKQVVWRKRSWFQDLPIILLNSVQTVLSTQKKINTEALHCIGKIQAEKPGGTSIKKGLNGYFPVRSHIANDLETSAQSYPWPDLVLVDWKTERRHQSRNQENVYDIPAHLDGAPGSSETRHNSYGETIQHRTAARGKLAHSNLQKFGKSEPLQQCGEGDFERSPQEWIIEYHQTTLSFN